MRGPSVPAMTRHIIVVGAGIGGLTAAAKLGHLGFDVTVVEQHAHVGGKMHHVCIDGVAIDTGPTVMTMRHVFDDLFAAMGQSLDAWVTLRPLDVLARHLWEDAPSLDLYQDVGRTEQAVAEAFGGDAAAGFVAYARYTQGLYRLACAPFIHAARPSWATPLKIYGMGAIAAAWRVDAHRSMMRALQTYFPKSMHLRQLFGRYATYTGGSPYRAPATLNLIAHVERMGVWSVDGGMHMLAEAVAALAKAQGVRFVLSRKIAALNTEGGRISGVRLEDGTHLAADAVVFNGDVRAITSGLVPMLPQRHALPQPSPAEAGAKRPLAQGLSAVTWGLGAAPQGAKLQGHTVLFAPNGGKAEFDALFEDGPACPSPTAYVCAPHTPLKPNKPGARQPLFCLVNAKPRRTAYTESDRARLTDGLCQRFQACGVTLDRMPTSADILHTPSDHAARFLGSDGALYGEAPHGWTSFFRRPASQGPMPGLFWAGGGVHPGAGVPMAALSGVLAAQAVHRTMT